MNISGAAETKVAILYITNVKKKLSNHLHYNHARANA
jgi:hypothetical protein